MSQGIRLIFGILFFAIGIKANYNLWNNPSYPKFDDYRIASTKPLENINSILVEMSQYRDPYAINIHSDFIPHAIRAIKEVSKIKKVE